MFHIIEFSAIRDLKGRLQIRCLKIQREDMLSYLRVINTADHSGQDVRWNGAMEGMTPGDTVILTVDRSVDSVCISLDERTECALAPSLGDGWGFLIYLEGGPNWIRTLTSLAWALGLGLVLGLV